VLLYDPEHGVAAAVHAGWRGTVRRIVEKTVGEMCNVYQARPQKLLAQIGPGIGRDSFEVGDEVYEAFAEAHFDMAAISEHRKKWHIDLPLCNRGQLLAAGLREETISMAGICTYQHADRFFSARRLGVQSGRILTGIIIRRG